MNNVGQCVLGCFSGSMTVWDRNARKGSIRVAELGLAEELEQREERGDRNSRPPRSPHGSAHRAWPKERALPWRGALVCIVGGRPKEWGQLKGWPDEATTLGHISAWGSSSVWSWESGAPGAPSHCHPSFLHPQVLRPFLSPGSLPV